MSTNAIICIVIFVITLAGFATAGKRYSLTMVSLASMLAMVITGCLDPKTALGSFGNANAVLMAAMFVVAAGFNRTQFIKKLSGLICKISGGSFTKIALGYIFVSFIMIQFVPGVLPCVMLICPMAIAVCNEMKVSPSRLIFPIALTIISTAIVLPTTNMITSVAQLNGYLESYNYTAYTMTTMDYFLCRLPVVIACMLLCVFVIPKMAPDYKIEEIASGKVSTERTLSKIQEWIGVGVFVAVLVALMFQTQIGMSAWIIALLGAVIIGFSGILNTKELVESLNLNMVLLYIATLGIGSALTETRAADAIGGLLATAISSVNSNFLASLILFAVPFILTQFMMNRGVTAIFQPLYIMLSISMNVNPIGPLMLCTTACMTSFLSPLATPAIPVVMGMGHYTQKDLLRMGWIPAVVITIVCSLTVSLLYPIF